MSNIENHTIFNEYSYKTILKKNGKEMDIELDWNLNGKKKKMHVILNKKDLKRIEKNPKLFYTIATKKMKKRKHSTHKKTSSSSLPSSSSSHSTRKRRKKQTILSQGHVNLSPPSNPSSSVSIDDT